MFVYMFCSYFACFAPTFWSFGWKRIRRNCGAKKISKSIKVFLWQVRKVVSQLENDGKLEDFNVQYICSLWWLLRKCFACLFSSRFSILWHCFSATLFFITT